MAGHFELFIKRENEKRWESLSSSEDPHFRLKELVLKLRKRKDIKMAKVVYENAFCGDRTEQYFHVWKMGKLETRNNALYNFDTLRKTASDKKEKDRTEQLLLPI